MRWRLKVQIVVTREYESNGVDFIVYLEWCINNCVLTTYTFPLN